MTAQQETHKYADTHGHPTTTIKVPSEAVDVVLRRLDWAARQSNVHMSGLDGSLRKMAAVLVAELLEGRGGLRGMVSQVDHDTMRATLQEKIDRYRGSRTAQEAGARRSEARAHVALDEAYESLVDLGHADRVPAWWLDSRELREEERRRVREDVARGEPADRQQVDQYGRRRLADGSVQEHSAGVVGEVDALRAMDQWNSRHPDDPCELVKRTSEARFGRWSAVDPARHALTREIIQHQDDRRTGRGECTACARIRTEEVEVSR